MKKKIETLHRETLKLDAELKEQEGKRKKAKHTARSSADEFKGDFLRSAAVIQRQLDADSDEIQQLQAEIERDEVEIEELRRKLSEQKEANRLHREDMESKTHEKLAELHEEMEMLRR